MPGRTAEFKQVRRSKKQAAIFGKGKAWRFTKAGGGTHLQKMGGYSITIPARPFLMVQNEDWTTIREALQKHLTAGK